MTKRKIHMFADRIEGKRLCLVIYTVNQMGSFYEGRQCLAVFSGVLNVERSCLADKISKHNLLTKVIPLEKVPLAT